MWATIGSFLMKWIVVPLFAKIPYYLMTVVYEMYYKWKQGQIAKENRKRYEEALKNGNEDERIDAATDMLNGVSKGSRK